jgi:putative transposase
VGIDVQVQACLNRPLGTRGYAYLYLDATYLHGRLGKVMQVRSRAVVVAMGVNDDGRRELLRIQMGESETASFWGEFIGSLKERGLTGVKLVISDAHVGLTNAIRWMLQGSCWQRCRVHYARKLLHRVPKAHQDMVTAARRSVFAEETLRPSQRNSQGCCTLFSARPHGGRSSRGLLREAGQQVA